MRTRSRLGGNLRRGTRRIMRLRCGNGRAFFGSRHVVYQASRKYLKEGEFMSAHVNSARWASNY